MPEQMFSMVGVDVSSISWIIHWPSQRTIFFFKSFKMSITNQGTKGLGPFYSGQVLWLFKKMLLFALLCFHYQWSGVKQLCIYWSMAKLVLIVDILTILGMSGSDTVCHGIYRSTSITTSTNSLLHEHFVIW